MSASGLSRTSVIALQVVWSLAVTLRSNRIALRECRLIRQRFLGDNSTYIAGNRDRSGGHKSGGLRLDFFGVDARPYAPAKTAGGDQSRAQHSCHTRWICADWAQSPERFWHFTGCLPNRRRDNHRIYGLRYASRSSDGWSRAADE